LNTQTLNKLGILSTTLIAATFQMGCAVATAPVETGGNTLQSGGLVWYVDGVNGSNYGDGSSTSSAFKTLSQAEAVALPGDTVEVENGTYINGTGPALDIVTPGSASGGYITFENAPGATPIIQVGAGAYAAVAFEPTAAYIILKGFTVLGPNKSLTLAGAEAAQSSPTGPNVVYNGNCISINGNTQGATTGAIEPNHIQILNNIAAYCAGGAIGGEAADYVTISGNTIYDSAWYTIYGSSAISLLGSYDTNPSDTTTKYKMQIVNNTIYGNEEFIPWVTAGKITDGEAIILDSNVNSAYITSPQIPYAPYTGRFLVANNVIYNDGSSAIEVFETNHADIVNNSTFNDNLDQASQSGRGEIELSNISDVNIYNNIFYASANSNGLNLYTACTPLPCTSDYNIYYGGTNNWNGYGQNGAHDITVNPLYTSTPMPTISGSGTPLPTDLLNAPTGVNLKLLSGSPAIGTGTSTLAPSTDVLGNPRPSANGYTRGAYSQ